MASGDHDTLVYRLSQILVKLNQGEHLEPSSLAEEFGVNLRTIQRDLNVRFGYLPIEKTNGRYHLDVMYLGKFGTHDINRFANLAGIGGLFPKVSADFLREIFDLSLGEALLVKGHHYEDIAGREQLFSALGKAISARQNISMIYEKQGESKAYGHLSPMKLVNQKGIWYLMALDGKKLKSFVLTRISQWDLLDSYFVPDKKILSTIEQSDGVWLSEQLQKFVFFVSAQVASYFERRNLLPNQLIESKSEDGGLVVSCLAGHVNQVLPIVRYWLPHMRILSPPGLQEQMEQEIRKYLEASQ